MNYSSFIYALIISSISLHISAQEPPAKRQKCREYTQNAVILKRHAQAELLQAQTAEGIKAAVAKGANINEPFGDDTLTTPLQYACLQNNIDTVKALTSYPTIITDGNQNPTPLCIACNPHNQNYSAQYLIIKYLLTAGAQITALQTTSNKDVLQETAYTQILKNSCPKIIKLVFNKYPFLINSTRNSISKIAQCINVVAFRALVNNSLDNLAPFNTIDHFSNPLLLEELYVAGANIPLTNLCATFTNNTTLNTRRILKTARNLCDIYNEKDSYRLPYNLQADIFSARIIMLQNTQESIAITKKTLESSSVPKQNKNQGNYSLHLCQPPKTTNIPSAHDKLHKRLQTLLYTAEFCDTYLDALFTVFKTTQDTLTTFTTDLSEEEYTLLYKKYIQFQLRKKLLQQVITPNPYCTVTIQCIR